MSGSLVSDIEAAARRTRHARIVAACVKEWRAKGEAWAADIAAENFYGPARYPFATELRRAAAIAGILNPSIKVHFGVDPGEFIPYEPTRFVYPVKSFPLDALDPRPRPVRNVLKDLVVALPQSVDEWTYQFVQDTIAAAAKVEADIMSMARESQETTMEDHGREIGAPMSGAQANTRAAYSSGFGEMRRPAQASHQRYADPGPPDGPTLNKSRQTLRQRLESNDPRPAAQPRALRPDDNMFARLVQLEDYLTIITQAALMDSEMLHEEIEHLREENRSFRALLGI